MPVSVEIPGQGVAEFPDEMSPDDIKGVIQKKFPPVPAAPAEEPSALRPTGALPVAGFIERAAGALARTFGGEQGRKDFPENATPLTDLVKAGTREQRPGETPIPEIPQQETTGKQIGAAVANVPIRFGNFILSPEGQMLGPALGMVPKGVRTLTGLLFGGAEAKAAYDAPTLQERLSHIIGAGVIGAGTAIDALTKEAPQAPLTEEAVKTVAPEATSQLPASEPETAVPTPESPAITSADAATPSENLADIGKLGSGAVTSMYDMMFKKLEAGDLTEGGGPSNALEKAYPEFQAGNIKSAEDLQKFFNPPKEAKLLPGETQGDLITSTQPEDLKLVGEKGPDNAARTRESEAAAQSAEEARLKAEHEQGLLADFQEHQAQGGDELLDAVKSAGGLKQEGSTLSGELRNVMEEMTARTDLQKRTTKSGAPDARFTSTKEIDALFKKDAPDEDVLTQSLRAKGFDIETPSQLLDLIKDRIRRGTPIFGNEARGAAMGIVPQPSEFVKQDVAKVLGGGFKAVRQIKSLLTPANVSEVSGITARVIRENAAELARKKEMAATSLKEAAKILRKNSPEANIDIINRLETGQDLKNVGLDAYKEARQSAYDERIKQVREVNPDAMEHLIENYFPHIWTEESRARVAGNLDAIPNDNAWARIFGKRPLEGSKGFLKQRSVPTTAEGIAIGLDPVTTNPVMLDLLKMHEMDRYVMGQKVMGELKERGVSKFVRAGDKPEPGYTKIDDRMARVLAPPDWKIVDAEGRQVPGQKVLGDYYAPEDAARVLNNYLSPGLRGFVPYDAFRFVGNMMNQVQLGISLYHATFTAIDAATSTLSLGLEQIARSGGSPKELTSAAGNIARAFAEAPVGGAFIENLWRGNKFLREYSKPGTTNAELARIVDAAVAGGARVKMDTFYNTGSVHSFFEALKTGNYAGAALRAPFALIETASKPLMEYAVPRMKLGIISQNLEYELSKLPAEATRDDVRKISARIVDSVDNRMGQMIYDNLFWNKTLKDSLMASVRSVGWNLGDIREIGGGILDTVTAPKRAYDSLTKGSAIADNPVVTKRMTYMVALPLMVGVLGSMYQYLMTGEGPQDLQDVFMPRTGRMKPDGSPERVMLPTYMKDIAPLALAAGREGTVGLVKRAYGMGLNKLHPAITTIGQMLHNQDYYGNQIRNADDGLVTTLQKESEFVLKNFRPFSVQGVSQREGGLKEKAQAVIGIMPAPHELTDTPAMRIIHDINLGKRPAGGYTAEQQQKREDRRRAQKGEDLRPEIFKRLSNEEKAKVLEVATPEEKQIFLSSSTSKKEKRSPYAGSEK